MDNGEETIEDNSAAQQLKKQARKVQLEALGLGIGLTALAFLLPVKSK
ncbi:MAG TPA: hypothetical protein VH186_15250 [Chloroflexia bacterium]|nr:hypothetical protein [Chloroflexia bacterium]